MVPSRTRPVRPRDLGRDYKRVLPDVTELEAWGLLARDDEGRLSAPYDELVVRAPLRAAA
jgi:predicted transcriptional regulator